MVEKRIKKIRRYERVEPTTGGGVATYRGGVLVSPL